MKRPWIERRDKYIAIHSKRNLIEFVVGKGKRYGLLIGMNIYEEYDWWHMEYGITFIFWFIGLKFRWRIFGNGYKHFDKEDIYI